MGLAPGVQVVLLLEVLREGTIRDISGAEAEQLAADLLGPHLGRVREQGKLGRGLAGWVALPEAAGVVKWV
jgi:hypothetical protein